MYPQCRDVRTSSDRCNAAAIKGSHWCYFHARLHEQQAQQAKRIAQEAERRRRDASRQPRLANGTFAPPQETIDQGIDPVSSATEPGAPYPSVGTWDPAETVPLQLTAVEDNASVQLALIEVLPSLAANQLDPRRRGLRL